jgi:hypothetical protein
LVLTQGNKQLAPLLPSQLASLYQQFSEFDGPGPTSGATSMIATSVKPFSKKLACPSSNLLLSFSRGALAREINTLIKHHLATCDFCYCEIPLLGYYSPPGRGECRVPDLPINLRVLAESILGRDRRVDATSVSAIGDI